MEYDGPVAKHNKWWKHLLPWERRNLKNLNAIIRHDWENGGKTRHHEWVRNYLLYGNIISPL